MTTEARQGRHEYLSLSVGLVLALCLSCSALPLAAQVWLLNAPLPAEYMVKACVSLRTTGSFRVALWWSQPYSARTGKLHKPFIQSNMACGIMPWAPLFPRQGDVQSSE